LSRSQAVGPRPRQSMRLGTPSATRWATGQSTAVPPGPSPAARHSSVHRRGERLDARATTTTAVTPRAAGAATVAQRSSLALASSIGAKFARERPRAGSDVGDIQYVGRRKLNL